MNDKYRIAIFASGNGTNAEALARHFQNHPRIQIIGVFSNRKNAGVLDRAGRLGLPVQVFSKAEFSGSGFLDLLENVDFIVLAGFLWLVPKYLVEHFHDRIINIHPALLPAYGGKGMFGHHVHEAVIAAKETKSGITIHLVTEAYDEGQVLFQATCPVNATDTPDTLAARIHELEHKHFPEVVEQYILSYEQ